MTIPEKEKWKSRRHHIETKGTAHKKKFGDWKDEEERSSEK